MFKTEKQRKQLWILIIILWAVPLSANNIAYFQNLGFNPYGDVFMFGQYGVNGDDSSLYAETYIIDVNDNTFMPDGVLRLNADSVTIHGQNGLNALFNLVRQQADTINQYEIDHARTGRIIYLLVNSNEPRHVIKFRDFVTGTSYTLRLNQVSRGPVEKREAAFHILLNVETTSGNRQIQTIGLPDYFRKNVNSYVIYQVIISPDKSSIVIVMEKISNTEDGQSQRYMIETAPLYN